MLYTRVKTHSCLKNASFTKSIKLVGNKIEMNSNIKQNKFNQKGSVQKLPANFFLSAWQNFIVTN